tara:strand:- start:1253 stop:2101 length:849 start_codon:yes stop_codon:yes gene_type:complete
MSQNFLSIYAKSFNWAGFFLPKKTYEQCSDLYDFCRTLDDIADQNQDLKIKKKLFNDFKEDFINKNLNNKNINKIYELIKSFNISNKIILDLFDGVESDLKDSVKLETNNELIIYSYRVAGTVGLMMAKILNVKSKDSLRSAIDLGIAMQLTNIARDVIEDSNRSRNYITLDFDKIRETLKLADTFYESSFKSINKIPLSCRFAILVARRVYRQIGNEILKRKNIENYKHSGKIYVSNLGKLNQTILSILDFIKLLFIKSDEHLRKNEHNIINEKINLDERF